jgi:hypothetical protein
MKSTQYIQIALKEIEEFLKAADHLELDDSMIESQWKKLLLKNHCMDDLDENKPLDPIGIIKNDLFQFEMMSRYMEI